MGHFGDSRWDELQADLAAAYCALNKIRDIVILRSPGVSTLLSTMQRASIAAIAEEGLGEFWEGRKDGADSTELRPVGIDSNGELECQVAVERDNLELKGNIFLSREFVELMLSMFSNETK